MYEPWSEKKKGVAESVCRLGLWHRENLSIANSWTQVSLLWKCKRTWVDSLCRCFTTQSRLLTTLMQRPFENVVGKGENAGNQHFLLFPQCFLYCVWQKSFLQLHFCRPWFCCLVKSRPIPIRWHLLTGLWKKPFEDIVGKGEIACTSNFSFSHIVF